MSQIYILGSGGHSRAVISTLQDLNTLSLMAVIDINANRQLLDNKQTQQEYILDVPVVNGLEHLELASQEDISLFFAIGSNSLRRSLHVSFGQKPYLYPNVIARSAFISESASIGIGNYIGPFAHIGPLAKVGNFNIINTYANIEHEVSIGNYSQCAPSATVCGRVTMGDNVFLGANATVLENLTIADNTTIGAGAVLISSTRSSGLTLVGVPARAI